MKLLRLAPLAVCAVFVACSGAPTSPSLSADAPPSFDSADSGGHMGGSGNRNDDGGGFGSGNLDSTSSNGDGTAPVDSTSDASRGTNMIGSGN